MSTICKTGRITGEIYWVERVLTDKADFDRHAEKYKETLDQCVKFSGYDSSVFAARKVTEMFSYMETSGTAHEHLRILDFGCGIGACEPYLAEYFPGADICAIDVSSESIALACERNQNLSNVQFSVFDGIQSPFSGTYDLIMMAGVLHHIDTAMRMKVLAGIRDVLSSRGRLFIFEHNPWNPLTRRIVRDCPFDDKADLVSPPAVADLLKKSGFVLQTLRFIYFFPYLLRLMVPMEKYLGMLPLGAQYYYVAGKQEI